MLCSLSRGLSRGMRAALGIRPLSSALPAYSRRRLNTGAVGRAEGEHSLPVEEYTQEELRPGEAMLRRIVADSKRVTGNTFIVPWHDEGIMSEMLHPIRHILLQGVKAQFVISACVAEPALFTLLSRQGDEATKILDLLVEHCQMPYEDSLQILARYGEELVGEGAARIQDRLQRVSQAGLENPKQLSRVVRDCPALLFANDAESLGAACASLCSFFSRKEIAAIVQRSPSLLFQNVEDIEAKYEYIYFQMCIEGSEFAECRLWAELPLEDIIRRHKFLLKTGRYSTPDKKKRQFKMENASLHEILDSSDEHFASAVAGVSMEEWTLYKALAEKQKDESEGGGPVFERIKPSQRKAYERRAKQKAAVPQHAFDSTADSVVE